MLGFDLSSLEGDAAIVSRVRYLLALDEVRIHPQFSVFEVAQVRFGVVARMCVVKDTSAGGAALHVTAFDHLPTASHCAGANLRSANAMSFGNGDARSE